MLEVCIIPFIVKCRVSSFEHHTHTGAAVAVPYSAAAGLELRPLGAAKYFEERQGFNVLDLLKNPMVKKKNSL